MSKKHLQYCKLMRLLDDTRILCRDHQEADKKDRDQAFRVFELSALKTIMALTSYCNLDNIRADIKTEVIG